MVSTLLATRLVPWSFFPMIASLSRRAPIQIVLTILTCLEAGSIGKTRLMYKANLDSRALRRYLVLLMKKGLILQENDKRLTYTMTAQGRDFVSRYRDLEEIFR
jgi:predicted transcriptional regulator